MIAVSVLCGEPLSKRLRSRTFYKSVARAAARLTPGWREIRTSIIFVSDQVIKELNSEYRGINRVTDILSVTIPRMIRAEVEEGELYIGLSQTKRQAKRYDVSLENEIQRLVIHGLLHLQGYDHMQQAERTVMRSIEKKISKELYG